MNEVSLNNQVILKNVINNIKQGKSFSHAYIINGKSSEENLSYAKTLAKSIICSNTYKENCEECNICSRIDKDIYPELKIILPTNNIIKKEQIVTLKNEFNKEAVEGRRLVYIISGAELLNSSSANSILKFLEEPDNGVVAIFTTNNVDMVMKTILSRCQLINITSKKTSLDINSLKKITKLDDLLFEYTVNYIFEFEKNKQSKIINLKDDFLKQIIDKETLKSVLFVWIVIYKDVLNYKIFKKTEVFLVNGDIEFLASKYENDKLIKKISLILENQEKLEYNINMSLFMMNFLIEMGETNG